MPLYEFRCPNCSSFDAFYPMTDAPDSALCPTCKSPGRRRISAPNLSRTGSSAFKLIDSTKRSAAEPQVIDSHLPGSSSRTTGRITSNPLHQKLPRP
ncbi:FmdB family zinc ribbon protein [Arthrobacter sp. H14-L1]|uniref:FmdB family zinc ribbon protein n=1 Tax=Arthrobacter sp. H14-L1 TaxID=2996697 RepID=UPI00227198E2|nr:zinc ribbon domain-containing protein [Arthrobacter sp. H14-L1]MCY0904193.1 zinc ribbon domain-containing protein [Arthrobacter sp. H14-L1]